MKTFDVKIIRNQKVSREIFLLEFHSKYLSRHASPGQFLNIFIDKKLFLRRPFSIHSIKGDKVSILYRIRGTGTLLLCAKRPKEKINVLGPLGSGFNLSKNCSEHILVAGGMGIAPLMFAAESLKKFYSKTNASKAKGSKIKEPSLTIILGAKTKKEVLCKDAFKKLGFKVRVSTEDGSYGFKGNALSLLKKHLKESPLKKTINLYSCGPEEMLKQLKKVSSKTAHIQVSLENFMGCGFGACCACSVKTKKGIKKVCKDGPVFNIKDLYF